MNIKDWGRRQEAGAGPAPTPTWLPRGLQQARGHRIKGSWVPLWRALGEGGGVTDLSLRVEVITSSTQAGGGRRGMSCSAAWAGEGRVALVWGGQAVAEGSRPRNGAKDPLQATFHRSSCSWGEDQLPKPSAVGGGGGFLGQRSAPSPDGAQLGHVREQG